jgi:hypothetical protein
MAKNITKVPNGPLIKKKGPFKGSTLKTGGSVKKTANGDPPKPNYSNMKTTNRSFFKDKEYTPTAIDSSYYRQGFDMATKGKSSIPAYDMKTTQGLRGYEEATKRGLNPKKKPKAKAGAMIKRAQNGESFTKDGNEYTYTKQVTRPEGKRKYEGKSIDQATAMKIANFKIRNNPSDSLRTVKPVIKKNGGLIKRADGSMSRRGLWDNIRANKGSGKKPTKQMLQQEKKIKAKTKK